MKPLAIDLFCGLGGWTEGLLAEGYDVVGFDIERHEYGDMKYPAQLVLQDVLTIHGKQFKDAALIVASPPCQEFSYMAMPWKRAKEKRLRIKADPAEQKRLTALFDACFRIQREACEAAGRHIPLVVENVRGAQEWVGRSRWAFGSFHLWGDTPALMPPLSPVKVSGLNWINHGKPGYKAEAFNGTAEKRMLEGFKGIPHRTKGHWTNPAENAPEGRKGFAARLGESKHAKTGSKSQARKQARKQASKRDDRKNTAAAVKTHCENLLPKRGSRMTYAAKIILFVAAHLVAWCYFAFIIWMFA